MLSRKIFFLCFLMAGCQMRRIVTSPVERRGSSGFAKDALIAMNVKTALSHHRFKNVKILVHRKVVLLVGLVRGGAEKDTAEMVVDSIKGVKKTINEIEIRPIKRSVFLDMIASQKAQSRLFLDVKIPSRDYHVTVVGNVAYVIGTSRSAEERDRVVRHLRNVSGIHRVAAHIFIEPDNKSPKP